MTMLPDLLRLTDPGLRETLDALSASMAVIGVGADGQPVTVDLDRAPHVLVSTCGGGGSSTILRTLTAQVLHHGAHALVLDLNLLLRRPLVGAAVVADPVLWALDPSRPGEIFSTASSSMCSRLVIT